MRKIALLSALIFMVSTAKAGLDLSDLMLKDTSYTHIPKRAALWSTFIPGAGQIYNEIGYRKIPEKKNRAWWKVPVIYGGLGACAYYFYYNNQYANLLKQEYLYQVDHEGYLDQRFVNYPNENALIIGYKGANDVDYKGYDKYAQRRDFFTVGFIAVWGLNVLEAYVDGHFVTFDVSEDLSVNWHPTLIGNKYPGLGINFNFN